MAYIYATNNPQYLEYVTRHMSRSEISLHPVFCQWANNPYTRDNMELAIRYNEAEDGDFQNKKDFVEFFMCNGPELDTDTLLYYRQKILLDDTYREIAYTYYANTDTVDKIRKTVYNKTHIYLGLNGEQKANCFTAPCNYLGPISCRATSWEDAAFNSSTPANIMADLRRAMSMRGTTQDSGSTGSASSTTQGQQSQNPSTGGTSQESVQQDVLGVAEGTNGTNTADVKNCSLLKWAFHLFPPSQLEMYNTYVEHRNQQVRHQAKELAEGGYLTATQIGDSVAVAAAETWELLMRANNKRNWGDCDRLIRFVAMFNPLDPSMNKRRPIQDTEIVKNIAPDGTPATQVPNPVAQDAAPPQEMMEQMMKNGQYRQLIAKHRETMTSDNGDNLNIADTIAKACDAAQKIQQGKQDASITEFRYWIALLMAKQNMRKMNGTWSWETLCDKIKQDSKESVEKIIKEACEKKG